MTLLFEEEGNLTLPLECESLAKRVIEAAIDYEIAFTGWSGDEVKARLKKISIL